MSDPVGATRPVARASDDVPASRELRALLDLLSLVYARQGVAEAHLHFTTGPTGGAWDIATRAAGQPQLVIPGGGDF